MSNTDDTNIKKISQMLEIGGTMLAQHCGACGAPLFRYQGRVLCPVCEDVRDPRGSAQSSPSMTSKSSPENASPSFGEKEEPVAASPDPSIVANRPLSEPSLKTVPSDSSFSEIETLLINKMIAISRKMQDEEDTRRIIEYLDTIERCMEVISKMRN